MRAKKPFFGASVKRNGTLSPSSRDTASSYACATSLSSFKITGVPPGSYTAVAWQEYTGPNEVPVSVKSKEATTVNVELKKSGASPIEQKR